MLRNLNQFWIFFCNFFFLYFWLEHLLSLICYFSKHFLWFFMICFLNQPTLKGRFLTFFFKLYFNYYYFYNFTFSFFFNFLKYFQIHVWTYDCCHGIYFFSFIKYIFLQHLHFFWFFFLRFFVNSNYLHTFLLNLQKSESYFTWYSFSPLFKPF